ncbi:MAG: hypothetical protein R3B45_01650 [Bdellovibrionota bacterium]
MQSIRFSRRPYTVKYYDLHGDLKEITRRPPKKIHNILPTDKVELRVGKNDDWPGGEVYTAKHINPKHPNTIQIKNDNDVATFVSALDLNLEEKINYGDGRDPRDEPINSGYLSWP